MNIQSVKVLVTQSCPTLCDPWTMACQAPLSMEFSRQEYWSGLPLPSPGDLPDLGIKPRSPALQADSLPSEPPGKPMNVQQKPLYVSENAITRGFLNLNLNFTLCWLVYYKENEKKRKQ